MVNPHKEREQRFDVTLHAGARREDALDELPRVGGLLEVGVRWEVPDGSPAVGVHVDASIPGKLSSERH